MRSLRRHEEFGGRALPQRTQRNAAEILPLKGIGTHTSRFGYPNRLDKTRRGAESAARSQDDGKGRGGRSSNSTAKALKADQDFGELAVSSGMKDSAQTS